MTRLLALAGLLGYSVLVFQLTLRDPAHGRWAFALADRLATSASHGSLDWERTEVLANIALFVPYGFLLTLVLGRARAAVLVSLAVSAGIELVQLALLPTRVPTTADVEHNLLGAILGAALAAVLSSSLAAVARTPARRPVRTSGRAGSRARA